jgi:hypothetical protein
MRHPDDHTATCINCGRETQAENGLCPRCSRHGRSFMPSEHRGRTARRSDVLGGSPIWDSEPDNEIEEMYRRYHGESPRDDI